MKIWKYETRSHYETDAVPLPEKDSLIKIDVCELESYAVITELIALYENKKKLAEVHVARDSNGVIIGEKLEVLVHPPLDKDGFYKALESVQGLYKSDRLVLIQLKKKLKEPIPFDPSKDDYISLVHFSMVEARKNCVMYARTSKKLLDILKNKKNS
jgi:hypothetical protein